MSNFKRSPVLPGQPKPYDFVPFAANVKRIHLFGHDQMLTQADYISGQLSITLQTLSPIFISNGRYELSELLGLQAGRVVRGFYRMQDQPIIPASSLKGLIRSIAEAVTPSCITATRVDRPKLPKGVTDTSKCSIGRDKESCPSCALFGSGGKDAHIGLVSFGDGVLVGDAQIDVLRLMPLYGPRVSNRQTPRAYLDTQERFRGRKFYFHSQLLEDPQGDFCEVLPTGITLTSKISFLNLNDVLLGILGFALGSDNSFKHKLGGGKPLALGSIAISINGLTLYTSNSYLEAQPEHQQLNEQELINFFQTRMQVAQQDGYLLAPQMNKLREILRYPNSRQGITGIY